MAIHCGRQNATITHFVKFMTTFFSIAHCGGNVVSHGPHESRTHRGIEQTVSKTNSFIRQFCAAPSIEDWPIRKQCRGHDSSFVSFTQFFPTCGRMPLPAMSLCPGRQPCRPRLVGDRRGGGPSYVAPRSRNPPTGRRRDSPLSSPLFSQSVLCAVG